MTAHSSILARKIPWTEEPSRLQSMGSSRLRSYRATEHTSMASRVVRAANKSFDVEIFLCPQSLEFFQHISGIKPLPYLCNLQR